MQGIGKASQADTSADMPEQAGNRVLVKYQYQVVSPATYPPVIGIGIPCNSARNQVSGDVHESGSNSRPRRLQSPSKDLE
eukprot:3435015-Prymnesium_polylepis.1